MIHPSENWTKIQSGDMKAFEQLFISLYPSLCNIADYYLKDEIQGKDIAQEAFIKLWNKRAELPSVISVKSYLYTTVRNLSLNYIKLQRKEASIPGILPDQADPEFKSLIIEEETIRNLYAAIDRLPPQTARVIRMTLQGIKNQEIAQKLNITVNSVKTLKYNAIHTLRRELEGSTWLLLCWLCRYL